VSDPEKPFPEKPSRGSIQPAPAGARMHFDDRLATVLRLPASGMAIARIQFRQLVDLLGAGPAGLADDSSAAAYARLDELAALIPSAERAAILREPMVRLGNPELVAHFARAEPDVASAAIHAADLTAADWCAMIPQLPVRARGILRHRRDFGPQVVALLERLGVGDRGLPPVAQTAVPVAPEPERPARPELIVLEGGASARSTPAADADEGIGAIVRRIDAFRKARVASNEPGAEPRHVPMQGLLAAHGALALDFGTDAEGRVSWADGPLAPALVGASLATHGEMARAMRHHQPLDGVMLTLDQAPTLAGPWRLDAVPRFEGPHGRFVGYAGRLRRVPPQPDAAAIRADSMRQVLHELRTPANAIQVAAEIIQQQLYGPAPHEYRALAAAIAGDTAQVLAGFDELDRLVKLETGALVPTAGECDLAAIVAETTARLRAWTGPRGGGFALAQAEPAFVPIEREDAARMIWRLLAALVGASTPGETLSLSVTHEADGVALVVDVPRGLAALLDQGTGAQAAQPGSSPAYGMFGIGFTLRLVGAEAAAAGGALVHDDVVLRLTLPGLTLAAAAHTQR
jgi:two-component system OmpR family sensor kinase